MAVITIKSLKDNYLTGPFSFSWNFVILHASITMPLQLTFTDKCNTEVFLDGGTEVHKARVCLLDPLSRGIHVTEPVMVTVVRQGLGHIVVTVQVRVLAVWCVGTESIRGVPSQGGIHHYHPVSIGTGQGTDTTFTHDLTH